jgi:hypothetical protein
MGYNVVDATWAECFAAAHAFLALGCKPLYEASAIE